MRLEWTNMSEVLEGIKKRQEKLKNVPKVARQMGVLALNEIHPLTAKKSHNWDNSIHAEVHQLSSFKWELWVGSKGAFSKDGYNYGARQERLYHPIEIGFNRATPAMRDLWQKVMHGQASSSVSMADSGGSDFGAGMASEFSMMSGF